MFGNGFAERNAPLRKGNRVSEGALHQADAADGVTHARAVEHFENGVDAVLRIAEQIPFAVAQFNFACEHGTRRDLVFDASYAVIEFAVFAAFWDEIQRETAHPFRR